MYKVIISFGMFSVVIIDYGRTFKQYFIKIYKDLKITLCVLYKVNHKGNKCENITILPTKYRQYMAMKESTKTFELKNYKTSQYVWNSDPINGTYIVQSVAAVGI